MTMSLKHLYGFQVKRNTVWTQSWLLFSSRAELLSCCSDSSVCGTIATNVGLRWMYRGEMLTSRRVKLAPELTKNKALQRLNRGASASNKSNSDETILTHLMTHTASEQQCDEDDETENSAQEVSSTGSLAGCWIIPAEGNLQISNDVSPHKYTDKRLLLWLLRINIQCVKCATAKIKISIDQHDVLIRLFCQTCTKTKPFENLKCAVRK